MKNWFQMLILSLLAMPQEKEVFFKGVYIKELILFIENWKRLFKRIMEKKDKKQIVGLYAESRTKNWFFIFIASILSYKCVQLVIIPYGTKKSAILRNYDKFDYFFTTKSLYEDYLGLNGPQYGPYCYVVDIDSFLIIDPLLFKNQDVKVALTIKDRSIHDPFYDEMEDCAFDEDIVYGMLDSISSRINWMNMGKLDLIINVLLERTKSLEYFNCKSYLTLDRNPIFGILLPLIQTIYVSVSTYLDITTKEELILLEDKMINWLFRQQIMYKINVNWFSRMIAQSWFGNMFVISRVRKEFNEIFGKFATIVIIGDKVDTANEYLLNKADIDYTICWGIPEHHMITTFSLSNEYQAGSVGKPISGMQIASHDEENVIGEILCFNYENEKKLKTGILGIFDAKGNLYVKGPVKHAIRTKFGFDIFPHEMEKVLTGLPYISRSCLVTGEREDELILLVNIDTELGDIRGKSFEDIKTIFEELRMKVNEQLNSYAQISRIEVVPGFDDEFFNMVKDFNHSDK